MALSSHGSSSSANVFDGRGKAKAGGGEDVISECGRSWHGLGNVGRLRFDPILSLCKFSGDPSGEMGLACVLTGVPIGPWSKFAMGNVGELAASDARMLVALNFNSGAKIEVLGGEGADLAFENPSPTCCTFSELACGDSSAMSWMAGLGERHCGPSIVGIKEMRTQFCRLCPGLRALGLPFRAEGLLADTGAGSH